MYIRDQVMECLSSAVENGYPHDYSAQPSDIVDDIFEKTTIDDFDYSRAAWAEAEDAVVQWRKQNPQVTK